MEWTTLVYSGTLITVKTIQTATMRPTNPTNTTPPAGLATRRTIDDASNEEWLHAAARIAGGNHVEDPDDEFSDSDTMSVPVRGEKESALCAVWFAYQADLISEQEVIRQSVALATAADLEISAMRKEIESLKLGVDILSLDGRDGNKPTNL